MAGDRYFIKDQQAIPHLSSFTTRIIRSLVEVSIER